MSCSVLCQNTDILSLPSMSHVKMQDDKVPDVSRTICHRNYENIMYSALPALLPAPFSISSAMCKTDLELTQKKDAVTIL